MFMSSVYIDMDTYMYMCIKETVLSSVLILGLGTFGLVLVFWAGLYSLVNWLLTSLED